MIMHVVEQSREPGTAGCSGQEVIASSKRLRMTRPRNQVLLSILASALIAACGPAPTPVPTATSTPVPVAVRQPTPSAPAAVLSSPQPTAEAERTHEPTTTAPAAASPERSDSMKISLRVEGQDTVITATLIDSQTARDFVSLLPLTLTLNDYAGTEKVSDLPKRLSTGDALSGSDPSIGDVAFYAPWGNLPIYYRDFGYSNGLVILARIDSNMEALDVPGSLIVTIEPVE